MYVPVCICMLFACWSVFGLFSVFGCFVALLFPRFLVSSWWLAFAAFFLCFVLFLVCFWFAVHFGCFVGVSPWLCFSPLSFLSCFCPLPVFPVLSSAFYMYTHIPGLCFCPWKLALLNIWKSSPEAAKRRPGELGARPGHKFGLNVYFWPKLRRTGVPLQPTGLLMFFLVTTCSQINNIFRKKHSKSRALTNTLPRLWVSEPI